MLTPTADLLNQASVAGFHCVTLSTPLPVGDVNVYLVDGDPVTLIDCGPRAPITRLALERGLAALGRSLHDIKLLLLTHQHLDHHGLAADFVHEFGPEVGCLDLLASYLERWPTTCAADEDYRAARMRRHGAPDAVLSAFMARAASRIAAADPITVDRRVADGDVIDLGRIRLRVVHRPGHSPTDTLFYDEDAGVAVVGDHLLMRISSNPLLALGTNSSPHFRPLREYRASLARTRAAPFRLLLTGHGVPVGNHVDLIDRRLAQQTERSAAIVEGLGRESRQTAWEIALALFGSETATKVPLLCFSEAIAHLELLEDEGQVAREGLDPIRFVRA
jgi:glyoxylase-like metal-dependent hydrolase (beta-lactamase superfamily II)